MTFIGLVLVIAPVITSGVDVSRSSRVGADAWSRTAVTSKAKLGLSFWRGLRQKLETKKKDLVAGDAHDSSQLSAVARRDLLWHAVRNVDEKFGLKYMCEISGGTTYAQQDHFLEGQTAFTKASIGSARECALMCASDAFGERIHKELGCKSFAFNKTSEECKLFNFAQQSQNTLVKDGCCTTGPPCNLDSMRVEIQKAFEGELKREMLSQRQRDNQLKTKAATKAARQTKHPAAKVEQKTAVPHIVPILHKAEVQAAYVAPKVMRKVVAEAKNVAPKVERKAAVQHVAPILHKAPVQAAHVAPKVMRKAVVEAKNVAPKVVQTADVQTKHEAPKVLHKAPVQAAKEVEQKAAVQTKHVAPITQTEPVKPLGDHIAPASRIAAHVHALRAHWRQWPFANWAGILLVAILAFAWLFRSLLAVAASGMLKRSSV